MPHGSPFTKGPLPNTGKNENEGLTNEEYERKYEERKRALSSASTASFNEAIGIENNDDGDNGQFNNARPGLYKPGAGSKASHLIPHIGNVRRPHYLTRVNLKNKADAETHAKVYTPYLNALTARQPSDPSYRPHVKRSGPTKRAYVFPPTPTVGNWTRKNGKNRKNRKNRNKNKTRQRY